MNKLKIIILREYLNKVQKKSFILLTVLTPLLFALLGGVIVFLSQANKSEQSVLYVMDETGYISDKDLPDNDLFDFQFVNTNGEKPTNYLKQNKDAYGIMVIPKSKRDNIADLGKHIKLYSDANPNTSGINYISNKLEKKFKKIKFQHFSIDESILEKTRVDVDISYISFDSEKDEEVERDEAYTQIRFGIGIFLAFFIYMFIFIYGVQIMRSVLEEKTTRVIEVVISSVKPFYLMLGKIIAAGLVALTQFLIWIILALIASVIFNSVFGTSATATMDSSAQQEKINKLLESGIMEKAMNLITEINFGSIIVSFILFFILGYLLYSSIFTAIGAASDTDTDTQQFMWPVSIPLMIAIYVGISLADNPHGPVGTFMSIFPLTSPIMMSIRLPFDPPVWQIILSLVLLLGSFILMVKVSAKIYSNGLLNFGKKASYKDLWQWIKRKK
jgi:ABC-2 type transport system permease protein